MKDKTIRKLKYKTNKSLTKRFKVTKKKKVIFRHLNQGHANAKDSGDETRKKRKNRQLQGKIKKTIIRLYSK